MKCPKCNWEIEFLIAYSLEENRQDVSLDQDGDLDYGFSEAIDESCHKMDFECPNCRESIYENDGWPHDPKIYELLGGKKK